MQRSYGSLVPVTAWNWRVSEHSEHCVQDKNYFLRSGYGPGWREERGRLPFRAAVQRRVSPFIKYSLAGFRVVLAFDP